MWIYTLTKMLVNYVHEYVVRQNEIQVNMKFLCLNPNYSWIMNN